MGCLVGPDWGRDWGRMGAGAYTDYRVGTGHVAYSCSDKNTRLTMN